MIVVATRNFELYHALVTELRGRDVAVTTIEPGEPLPEGTDAVLTGPEDTLEVPGDVARIEVEADAPRAGVQAALERRRGCRGRRVVGVDPGSRPGIAVLDGEDVVAAFQVPLSGAAERIRAELEGAVDPVVRIGDGARLRGSRLIDALDDVRIELVDETGSTPHLGAGARGMGDVLAAVNIARREGEPIERREIQPTAGELRAIKTESRERSTDNRTITEGLARRVAKGELTIEDALAEHADE